MGAHGNIWDEADWPQGWRVRHVVETGSTNTDLLDDIDAGVAGDRSVLATAHQTAGRGRLDRRWDAPPGTNLLVSICVAPVPTVAVDATHRVALGAVLAARTLRPDAALSLKWPNDLLIGDLKLAGILAQRSNTIDAVVVGLGLNVGWAPAGAGRLARPGESVPGPAHVLALILEQLDRLPDDIGSLYRSELSTLSRRVRVELPGGGVVEGVAIDVDDAGRLVVRSEGGDRTFDVGDVVHVRPADGGAAAEPAP